jgi:hypothetical protein
MAVVAGGSHGGTGTAAAIAAAAAEPAPETWTVSRHVAGFGDSGPGAVAAAAPGANV